MTTTAQVAKRTSTSTEPFFHETAKSLQSGSNNKALGAGQNTELAAWYEQAYDYYNSVMNGTETRPDDATWNEFLNQMNWAYSQLNGSSQTWDPMAGQGAYAGGAAGGQYQPTDPFGGMMGTNGDWVHTEEEARVGFTGSETRHIWSNDVNLDVAALSVDVQVAKVMDESYDPPEEVLKFVLTDRATGQQAVWIVHDYEDANISVNVPDPSTQVHDNTGVNPPLFEVNEFEAGASGPSQPQASIPGEAHPTEDNWTIYEGRVGENIEFYPEPSGEAGEVEYYEVYGDSKIVTLPSDHTIVSKGMPDDPDGYTVIVKHRDGSQDVFYIHKSFDVGIYANEEYLTWDDGTLPATDVNDGVYEGVETGVPSEFSEHFSLGGSGSTNSDAINPDHPEDVQPDDVEGDTAYYNTSANVDIHPNFDDDITNYDITAPGTVVIHGNNYSAKMNVNYDENNQIWTVTVQNGSDPTQVETYTVHGGPDTKIILDVMENNVTGDKSSVQLGLNGTPPEGVQEEAATNAVADQLSNVDGINMSADEIADTAQRKGFDVSLPPAVPNNSLFSFLVEIDPILANLLEGFKGANSDNRQGLYTQIRDRMVQLLQILYPNAGVQAVEGDGVNRDDIIFGGTTYDIVNQDYSGSTLSRLLYFDRVD